ncbi:hypothetical protein BGZ95_009243 [Linnemannia exigua]|uniref:Transmembrane protein n=1 Tax=Linnemannia exigua TaxID=604196 RepID=A0AAD4DD86_9FUNG|nr:hypothetical protein BGZ95_009243 [Linnemannia exigua]
MSTTTIPNYPHPCLAADENNSAVYLVGVNPAVQGRLEVNYVSMVNINTLTSSPVGSQVNTNQWSSGAPKACFIYPAKIYANSPLSVFQFGNHVSYSTTITPNGTILKGDGFVDNSFLSPKLFALSGSVGSFEWFLAMTNETGNPWAGIRLNFTDPSNDILDMELINYPTTAPLVAVGTYSTDTNPPSKGYSVVFDKYGQGQIFSASGSMVANMTNDANVLVLSAGVNVQMNSIILSDQAVPVTMVGTGYILDKAQDGSTIVYSITPERSSALQRIEVKGGSPPFSSAFAATAMNKQIITYAPSTSGSPTFNSFDTTTRTWGGPGLMSNGGGGGGGTNPTSDPTPESSKTPVAAVIGGVAAALAGIALVVFLFIRQRRKSQQQHKRTENPESVHHTDSTDKASGGRGSQMDYLQELPPMQQVQYYQNLSYEQQYPSSSTIFVPPPPPVNPNAVTSFAAFRPTSTDSAPSELNLTPYGSPYVSPSPYSNNANRGSIYSATPLATTATDQDYSYTKSRASSYGGSGTPLSPQVYPQPQDEKNNPRSPQSFGSTSPNNSP